MAGGVIALFEYFGRSTAATATGGSSSGSVALPAWLPSLSPTHMVSIVAALVLLLLYFYLTRAVAEQAEELLANKLVVGIGKALLIIGFLVLCHFVVDIVHDSQAMIDLKFSPPWRWFWSVMTVAMGALLPFQSLANWVVKTDGAFAKAVRRFVVVTLLGVVLFMHAKEGRTLKDNYDDVKPFFAGIQLPERKAPPPPPPPPPAPPKEEKKMIAAKEKRWREASNREELLPSTYPFDHMTVSYRQGKKFGVPPMGEGSCAALWVKEGEIESEGGLRHNEASQGPAVSNCNNQPIYATARTDARVEWGACRAPDKWCLIWD